MNYAKALFLPLVMAATFAPLEADAQPMSECFIVDGSNIQVRACEHAPGQIRTTNYSSQMFIFTNNTSSPITVGVIRAETNGYPAWPNEVALEWTLQPASALQWSDATPKGGYFPWVVWCPGGQKPYAKRGSGGYLGYSCGDNYYPLPG